MRLVPSFPDRIKAVGKSIAGLFAPVPVVTPLDYTRGGASGLSSFWSFGADGQDRYFSFAGMASCVEAYSKCAPFAAVINRKTSAFLNGKTWILDKGGKKDGKESQSPVAQQFRKLLQQPNPLQSWSQFEAQSYLYKQVFGYSIVLVVKPAGFANYQAKSMYNLPPWCCEILESTDPYAQTGTKKAIEKIVFTYGSQKTVINGDFLILSDFTPSFETLALPASRVHALELPINNCIGAMESRNVLINYRGAMGILTSDKQDESGDVALTPAEKEQAQAELRQYGLRNTQMQFIITTAKLKWQSMAHPAKDLMLIEEVKDSMQQICDGYGYPYRMLSANDVNSLGGSDLKEYKKAFYQDTIIPEAEDMYSQLTRFFELDKYNLILDKDYSHLPILQEDKKEQAEARKALNEALNLEWQANLITKNQWLVKLGEDPIEGFDVRLSDANNSNLPLASVIGVGGVQALIEVLTAPGLNPEARRNTVEIVFGVSAEDAARMVSEDAGNNQTLPANETQPAKTAA